MKNMKPMKTILKVLIKLQEERSLAGAVSSGICCDLRTLLQKNRIKVSENIEFKNWLYDQFSDQKIFFTSLGKKVERQSQFYFPIYERGGRDKFISDSINKLKK